MQIYGNFDGFPLSSALFGLVSYHDPYKKWLWLPCVQVPPGNTVRLSLRLEAPQNGKARIFGGPSTRGEGGIGPRIRQTLRNL